MLNEVYLWIAFGIIAMILIVWKASAFFKSRSRVWIKYGGGICGYLEPGKNDKPAQIYTINGNKVIGCVEQDGDMAKVYLREIDEDSGSSKDTFLGTVDKDGRVFKAADYKKYEKRKNEKLVYGFTAKPNAEPLEPSTEAEPLKIVRFFGYCLVLNVFKGHPPKIEKDRNLQNHVVNAVQKTADGKNNENVARAKSAPIDAMSSKNEIPESTKASEAPAETKPVEDAPSTETPKASEAPAETKPVEDAPSMETPKASEAPAETMPIEDAPSTETPKASEAPEETKPVETAPSTETPKASEAPAETIPIEDAPSTDAPKQADGETQTDSKTDDSSENKGDNAPLNSDFGGMSGKPKRFAECRVSKFEKKEDSKNIPNIVKAAAFILLYAAQSKKNRESLPEEKHGWRDTAFFAMIVYTFIYLAVYSIYCFALQMPMIGQNYKLGATFAAFYFLIWALVRQVKLGMEERGNYKIQHRLNLLNKIIGMSVYSITISVMAAISILLRFIDDEKNFELLPLEIVVVFGVLINYILLPNAKKKWNINDKFDDRKLMDTDDEDDGKIPPPEGDNLKKFNWKTVARDNKESVICSGQINIRFDDEKIKRLRQDNPFYMQRVNQRISDYVRDMFDMVMSDEALMHRVRWVAQNIREQGANLDKGDFYQFVLDFVQEPTIKFVSDQNSKPIDYSIQYIRFPDETLYDGEGDADCKSFLALMIFYALGYNVLFLYSSINKHALIGVEPLHNWYDDYFEKYGILPEDAKRAFIVENGHQYLLCEVTGDNFVIGQKMNGLNLVDFEEKVPFVHSSDSRAPLSSMEKCSYKWNYKGNDFQFCNTFDQGDVASLRSINPFAKEGGEKNIQKMYKMYLPSMHNSLMSEENYDYLESLQSVLNSIRKVSAEKKIQSDYEILDVCLSFVQQAIKFKQDDESRILHDILKDREPKEYVRFPMETLFDQEGDCDCKSFLTAMLFSQLGNNVVYLASSVDAHAAVGLEYKKEWAELLSDNVKTKKFNGKDYLFCETTGSREKPYGIGQIPDELNIANFNVVMEIPAVVKADE